MDIAGCLRDQQGCLIVGTGIIDGEAHAFLATDPPATAVPEPDSFLGTLVLSIFGVGARIQAQKRSEL